MYVSENTPSVHTPTYSMEFLLQKPHGTDQSIENSSSVSFSTATNLSSEACAAAQQLTIWGLGLRLVVNVIQNCKNFPELAALVTVSAALLM